jgi:ATP-binding cassette subfamily F protein uup
VQEYVGGYEDWLRQRPVPAPFAAPPAREGRVPGGVGRVLSDPATPKKLTYREREELEQLPSKIHALEEEQRALAARIAAPDFYKEPADAIAQALERVDAIHDELLEALARWDELESRPR